MSKKREIPPVIGIGGAIGSGKSLVANQFTLHKAVVIDLDRLSRSLAGKGKILWREIIKKFGPSFLDQKGNLLRGKLARVVFKNWNALFLLNRISHPILKNETKKSILHHPPSTMIIIDGAVLYEAGLIPLIDCLIFVDAPEKKRELRLIQKGIPRNEVRTRIESQRFISCLRRRSHIIIENNTTPEDLQQKIDLVCELPMEKIIPSRHELR